MVRKKTYITIGVIFGIYGVAMLAWYFGFVYTDITILMDTDRVFKYDGTHWIERTEQDSIFKNFNVYNLFEPLGRYDIKFSVSTGRWSAWNSSNERIPTDVLFAFKGNRNLRVIPFEEQKLTPEFEYVVRKYLEDKGIAISLEECYSILYEIDLDNDGRKEQIISIVSDNETNNPIAFGALIIYRDGKIHEIFFQKAGAKDIPNVGFPYLHTLIDIRENGRYEMFIGVSYFGNSRHCISVVETTRNDFDIKIRC